MGGDKPISPIREKAMEKAAERVKKSMAMDQAFSKKASDEIKAEERRAAVRYPQSMKWLRTSPSVLKKCRAPLKIWQNAFRVIIRLPKKSASRSGDGLQRTTSIMVLRMRL